MVNCPVSPRFIVAGPVLSTIRLGAAIVSGGLMPHSPGRGSWNTPLINRPKSHFAVLMNCVPMAFAGVSSSTTVMSMTNWRPAGMMRSPKSKVSSPPALEKSCGTGVPVSFQVMVWLT